MSSNSQTEAGFVRDVVRRWGWNGTSYQILNPGFTFWTDTASDAVVGYIERHGVRVVGGAPVCADARLEAVVAAFESDAARAGHGVVYFAAEQRMAELAQHDGRRVAFPIGAQPMWRPATLLREFAQHASLRAQVHRARNKGVSVHRQNADDVDGRRELRRCLQEWIDQRGLPPLHFLVETATLDDLVDRHVLVAEHAGRITEFLVATPIPARNGWLVEQLVRGRGAPNGTAELLLFELARILDRDGARMMTLGLAPLARRGELLVDRTPRWTAVLLRILRAHGRRFYNFEGLEQFKAKFGGAHWDPVYVCTATGTTVGRSMLAITAAFCGTSLWKFAGRAVTKALLRA